MHVYQCTESVEENEEYNGKSCKCVWSPNLKIYNKSNPFFALEIYMELNINLFNITLGKSSCCFMNVFFFFFFIILRSAYIEKFHNKEISR